jgi:ABC-type amino acid transport substrate-binding protein
MHLPLFRSNSKGFKIIILISTCLVLIFWNAYVTAQTSLPNEIRLGVRTASYAIATYDKNSKQVGGFCGTFREKLASQTGSTITNRLVKNEYLDRTNPRFGGLLTNKENDRIDIQCGPDSITSGKLIDPNSNKRYSEELSFSKPFYRTGVKLLLKKTTANQNGNINIKNLTIGAVQDTTTLEQLKHRVNIVPKEFSTRSVALTALKDGSTNAYAGDALILQTLLQDGLKGEELKPHERFPPFGNEGYTIYPPEKGQYLTDSNLEDYAIVIKKGTAYHDKLLEVIDNAIEQTSREYLGNAEQNHPSLENPLSNTSLDTPEKMPSFIDNLLKNPPLIVAGVIVVLMLIFGITITAITAVRRGDVFHQHGSGDNIGRDNIGRDKVVGNLSNKSKNEDN